MLLSKNVAELGFEPMWTYHLPLHYTAMLPLRLHWPPAHILSEVSPGSICRFQPFSSPLQWEPHSGQKQKDQILLSPFQSTLTHQHDKTDIFRKHSLTTSPGWSMWLCMLMPVAQLLWPHNPHWVSYRDQRAGSSVGELASHNPVLWMRQYWEAKRGCVP